MNTEITLPASELKTALPGLSKVVSRKTALPVLQTVKVSRLRNGQVTLQGTDLDSFVTYTLIGAQPGQPIELLVAANDELEKITPQLRAHPTVLVVRYEIYSKAEKWDGAAEIAGTLVKLLPERAFTWICWAYATRRKTGGGIPAAKEILTKAEAKFPKDHLIRYNLACYECRLGNLKEAMVLLEKAIDLAGKKDIRMMALNDRDLEKLWKDISEI